MKIAFCITTEIRHRCFAPRDTDRLNRLDVRYATAASELALRDEMPRLLDGAELLMTGWHTPPVTDALLDCAPGLRFIVHSAGSVRHLLPPGIFSRGVRLATCNAALAIGVAETTLGMIISGLKNFDRCAQLTRAGGWKRNDTETDGFLVRELFGMTIGLIGLGQVGQQLARLLQAFELEVLACDPYATPADADALNVRLVSLPELLERSDLVSLHAPALPTTVGMLGTEQFAKMKDHAIFINTARGAIVDEDALVAELRTGRISAILDVTHPEPPAADHPLRSLPNVVLTPHIAGSVANGCLRMGRLAVDQALAFATGRKVPGEVSAEALAIMA